jgi:hypothetical protein
LRVEPAEISDVGHAHNRQRGDHDDDRRSDQRVGDPDRTRDRAHDGDADRDQSEGAEHVVGAHA